MAGDIREQVADNLLAIMPLYHRHIFRLSSGSSGIRIAQYRMLGLLMKSGPLSMTEIGKHLYISKPSMTTLADSMIEQEWIEQATDPADRRIKRISITQNGKMHLRQAFSIYREDVKVILSQLDEDDLSRLSSSLDEIRLILGKLE